MVIERAFVLALTGDERALMAQISELDGLGAPAEQALLQALYADLRGDLRTAVDLFATAARGRPIAQPRLPRPRARRPGAAPRGAR